MAKQIKTDDEFTLQRQARRRLIGAIALMLAVVIFLPMIFDADPAATVTRDIELRIPEKVATLPVPVPVPVLAQNTQQEAGGTSTTATPAITENTIPPVTLPPAPAPIVAGPLTVTKPVEKSSTKPVVPAPARPVGKPSGWVVQVGAYSKADTARQMVANLKQRGYPVFTEQAGAVVRVRVGAYPSKDAADKVRAKLEAIGLHPNVLNPD